MLKAIYKGGSQLLLANPHDKDFIKVYDTVEEAHAERKANRDFSVDWHFASTEKIPFVCIYCYIFPLMELIEGKEIKALKKFNMLDHKEEYTEIVKKFAQEHDWQDKRWYHIVIAYFMFKKGELTLTDEEKEIAQRVHDNGVDDEMYNTLIEYFK